MSDSDSGVSGPPSVDHNEIQTKMDTLRDEIRREIKKELKMKEGLENLRRALGDKESSSIFNFGFFFEIFKTI